MQQERKADDRHDCRCGTQDCVLHGRGQRGKRSEGRTRGSAPTGHAVGLRRGWWVKGAKAGSKAGRRLKSLPHKSSRPLRWIAQSGGPRRQSWRRRALGNPGQVVSARLCRRDRRHWQAWRHAPLGGEGDWAEQRAVGEGGQGRLESRPQAGKPAPQEQPAMQQERKADHRHDCRCGTQDCVLHGRGPRARRAVRRRTCNTTFPGGCMW